MLPKIFGAVMRRFAKFALLMLALYPLGVICHELVGHGLTGILFGGRLDYAEILGVQLWPSLQWIGWQGHYGMCGVKDITGDTGRNWMALGGSLSTWLIAVFATLALNAHRWRPRMRVVLACLSLWWIDILTYTLPTWGIKRSILWGALYSEPYDAAVDLGVPGWLFQSLVVASSGLLLVMLIRVIARPPAARTSPSPAASP